MSEEQKNEQEVKETKEKKKIKKGMKSIFLFGGVVVLLIIIALFLGGNSKERKINIVCQSTLEKVEEISELALVEYPYNSVATVKDGKKVQYYVYYKGTVRIGIDISKIGGIDYDAEKKVIIVDIPDVEIQEVAVDIENFIYVKNNYDETSITKEANLACEKHLKEKVQKDEDLLKRAEENAKSLIESLIMPSVKKIDDAYKLEFK